ncbi:putative repeat protein (TIGR03943 family) [Modestobacter roseus]|uniref:Putative repeat protein (TIGR03943 family) n=3 Tax=Modestobacter roseus TaxID=1181884 RepID=A0A562IQR6_9ACTN|nr:TIGR03943 family protein [Modestobacter roseus]TWH73156.1 putative repeat protein (TIGR03943 family) [Modestobacter roseus]
MSARPDRPTQQVLLLLLGLVVLVVALTDQHLAYVRAGFQPFLVAAGVLLVAVGGLGLLRDRGRRADHPGPGVGWLLAAPVAVLVVVAPPALGAFSVDRLAATPVAVTTAPAAGIGPDDAGADHRTMTLLQFTIWSQADPSALAERQVRLVGFAVPRDDGGWDLARFSINCCAADATALRVQVAGDRPGPAADQWVQVVGTAGRREAGGPPVLRADVVSEVPAPAEPYE